MTPADHDRIHQALGPDWSPFRAAAYRWYDENEDRLRQAWEAPVDAETLLSFELGIYLHDVSDEVLAPYDVTPQNSFTFARTGGDGEHFSVLLDPPAQGVIVLTAPMAFDQPNTVVGESLRDVLSLASGAGFGVLPNLAYLGCDRTEALIRNAAENAVFASIRTELGLTPWPDICGRLAKLADRFSDCVVPRSNRNHETIGD